MVTAAETKMQHHHRDTVGDSSSINSSSSSPLNSLKQTMPKAPQRKRSPPRHDPFFVKHGLFIMMSAIAFLLLASLLLSISFVLHRLSETAPAVVGSTWNELVEGAKSSPAAVTCQETRRKVARGTWLDPNKGKVYARHSLTTAPSFAMAVHEQSYDPVRWDNIYVKGKYYEDLVHARFVEILEPNGITENSQDGVQTKRGLRSTVPKKDSKPVSLVLDVGANIGYYTMLSMALGYSVLAFEINPPNLLRMCESLELNHWTLPENDKKSSDEQPRVRFYQNGISNFDGENLEVWVPKNPGQAFMKAEGEKDGEGSLAPETDAGFHHDHTTTISLDTFAEQHGWLIAQPDGMLGINPNIEVKILKVDVEGKEPLVVEGAQALLRSGIVTNILIEFRRLARPNVQQALLLLLESGYTLIDENEGKVSLTRSKEILVDLTEKLQGKRMTVDLWFQRV